MIAELAKQAFTQIATAHALRVHLTDRRLRRVLEVSGIYQSVWGKFFECMRQGERFSLHEPKQLINLLAEMARNKLINRIEEEQAGKRAYRKVVDPAVTPDPVDANPNAR